MTLQQLKYVIAVNRYRNYARAAVACSVTQPTLSAMLLKLENELGVRLFERTNKSVVPTLAGEKVIHLAEKTLADVERINDIASEGRECVAGDLKLSIGPTIASYILPDFIARFHEQFPQVHLLIRDMKLSSVQNALLDGSIDVGIGIAGSTRKGIKEIPLYEEPIVVYASNANSATSKDFLWVMKEALSLRENTYGYYREVSQGRHIYEATNVEQLIRMVDCMGGSTVIPQMHLRYLTREQMRNVVEMEPEKMAHRQVSLYVKSVHGKQQLLDGVITVLKQIIPPEMVSPTL